MTDPQPSIPSETGEKPPQNEKSTSDLITGLREDFQAQINALKEQQTKREEDYKSQIEQLKTDKEALQRALVREASLTPPQPTPRPPEKTEEELYKERIEALAKKTNEIERYLI